MSMKFVLSSITTTVQQEQMGLSPFVMESLLDYSYIETVVTNIDNAETAATDMFHLSLDAKAKRNQ